MARMMILGAACSIASAFPWAAVVGTAYGFPVPFVGKVRGFDAIIASPFAVLAYGLMGGFLLLGLLGAAAGAIAHRIGRPRPEAPRRLCVALSLSASLACVLALATLDLVIGSW